MSIISKDESASVVLCDSLYSVFAFILQSVLVLLFIDNKRKCTEQLERR